MHDRRQVPERFPRCAPDRYGPPRAQTPGPPSVVSLSYYVRPMVLFVDVAGQEPSVDPAGRSSVARHGSLTPPASPVDKTPAPRARRQDPRIADGRTEHTPRQIVQHGIITCPYCEVYSGANRRTTSANSTPVFGRCVTIRRDGQRDRLVDSQAVGVDQREAAAIDRFFQSGDQAAAILVTTVNWRTARRYSRAVPSTNPASFMSWIMRSLSSDIVRYPFHQGKGTPATTAGNPSVSHAKPTTFQAPQNSHDSHKPLPSPAAQPLRPTIQSRFERRRKRRKNASTPAVRPVYAKSFSPIASRALR